MAFYQISCPVGDAIIAEGYIRIGVSLSQMGMIQFLWSINYSSQRDHEVQCNLLVYEYTVKGDEYLCLDESTVREFTRQFIGRKCL